MESSMRCIFLFVEDESCNRMCKCSLQQAMYACVYCFALCLCSNYVVFRILDDTKVITSKTDRNSINACVKCEWQSLHKIFIFIIIERYFNVSVGDRNNLLLRNCCCCWYCCCCYCCCRHFPPGLRRCRREEPSVDVWDCQKRNY